MTLQMIFFIQQMECKIKLILKFLLIIFQMIVILKLRFNNDIYFGNEEKNNFFLYF